MPTYDALVSAIERLVTDARAGLKAAMNAIMLQTYWRTGEYIVEYEQNGSGSACFQAFRDGRDLKKSVFHLKSHLVFDRLPA